MGVKYQVESVLYENLRVESCVCLLTGTCQLNESWRGSWFQSGFDNIHINSTSIDVKGRCLESDRDYFLFEDRYFHFISFRDAGHPACALADTRNPHLLL